jgi:hypothetical protein
VNRLLWLWQSGMVKKIARGKSVHCRCVGAKESGAGAVLLVGMFGPKGAGTKEIRERETKVDVER